MSKRAKWTPEQRARENEQQRARRAAMTPEEREKQLAQKRECARRWRAANPEKARERDHAYCAANREAAKKKSREYYAANHQDILERQRQKRAAKPKRTKLTPEERHERRRVTCRKYREAHPDRVRASQRKHYAANPGKQSAILARRRASKRNRTPAWADLNAITAFYEACPPGQQVDHFYPLQGREVSGLHTLENLRYLPARENMRKNNSMPRVQIFHLPTAEEIRGLDGQAASQTTRRHGWAPRARNTDHCAAVGMN
jgi:hypothetical protein